MCRIELNDSFVITWHSHNNELFKLRDLLVAQ